MGLTSPGLRQHTIPCPAAGEPLRIAVIAPPYFTVPPHGYGGIETVVADLVDGLVARGHHVTLVGAGRHATRAQRFLATTDPPSQGLGDPLPEVVHAARVAARLDEVTLDVVHDHTLAGPLLARGRLTPTLVTVHGPVSGEPGAYYRALGATVGLVGISEAQRRSAPELPWIATVHNAVRVQTFPFRAEKQNFALFLGRFHPDKAPHLAIDAARAAGLPIVLAGKCSEPIERDYLEREIVPRLGADTTMFGVADAAAKRDLLARACALLFPIRWDEPFGMVMIEAMACGTPVVALRRGSVPEIVRDGVSGIIVESVEDLPEALEAARGLDPARVRAHVETGFDVGAMTRGYESAYRGLLAGIAEPVVRLGDHGVDGGETASLGR